MALQQTVNAKSVLCQGRKALDQHVAFPALEQKKQLVPEGTTERCR